MLAAVRNTFHFNCCKKLTMKHRNFMIIGVVVFCAFGYWSGLGYYINMTSTTLLPSDILYYLKSHRNRTSESEPNIVKEAVSKFVANVNHVENEADTTLNVTTSPGYTPSESSVLERTNTTIVKTQGMFTNLVTSETSISTVDSTTQLSAKPKSTVDSTTQLSAKTISTVDSTTQLSAKNISTVDSTTQLPTTNSENENMTLYITTNNLRDGRLGNQMFRYASLVGIARAQGRQLVIPPVSELENTFRLSHIATVNGSSGWRTVFETNAYSFNQEFMNLTLENFQIAGFLQCYKYFDFAVDEVIKEFRFKFSVMEEALKIIQKITQKYTNRKLIGVHVRRGDFLLEEKIKLGYMAPKKSYFSNAFHWIKTAFPGQNFLFLVASDDVDWCKENILGPDVIVLPSASASVHMAILSSCDHVIITGGTYGWWTAFLSRGQVIYFKGFMYKGTAFGDQFDPKRYYPLTWIGIDN